MRSFCISCLWSFLFLCGCVIFPSYLRAEVNCHSSVYQATDKTITVIKTPTDGGIQEIIPAKYRDKYQKWKDEFLTTDFGKEQWKQYSENKNFILILKISPGEGQGAGTHNYLWNDKGELVGATIELGNKMDKGYPDPVYYPVMNSLSLFTAPDEVKGKTLAATKIAHEFGHVNLTLKTNSDLFQLQNKLMDEYNTILLSNGHNVRDDKLVKIAVSLGGTPVEIWENREYWGETNAMRYLMGKINKEFYYCSVLTKIETNLQTYARPYKDRFSFITQPGGTDSCFN